MSAYGIIVWLMIIVFVFVIILGYSTVSRIVASDSWEDIKGMGINESTDATETISTTETVWQYFPYVAVLALVTFGIFALG